MDRGRFAASSGVVVDVCVRHGVWLDHGELGRIAAWVRSPQRPVDPAPGELSASARAALEQERLRIAAIAASLPRAEPPRPLWLKLIPVLLLVVGVAARWWYVQRVAAAAAEQGVDFSLQGETVKSAGQQGTDALGR